MDETNSIASTDAEAPKDSWQLKVDAYARHGIDLRNRPMEKTIRKMTREEWLQSEEDAYREHEAIMRS